MSLRLIGFQIIRVADTHCFSYLGSDDNVCRTFSTRSNSIKTKTEQMGLEHASASVRNRVAIFFRPDKTHAELKTLLVKLKTKMSELGYEKTDLYDHLDTFNQPSFEPLPILQIIKKLTETNATITEAQIYECVAREAQYFHVNLDEIYDTVANILNHKKVLGPRRDRAGKIIYSKHFMLNIEKELVLIADELRAKNYYELPSETIEYAISKQEKEQSFMLSAEQKMNYTVKSLGNHTSTAKFTEDDTVATLGSR
jgi:hypothetical protein